MEDYSKLSAKQLADRRARVTDMMKNGSGADMANVMTLDRVIAQEEARRQKEKPLTRDSDERTAMDDFNEANTGKSAAGSKKESGGSSEPRRTSMMSLVTKTPEEIDTDRLHREALARSEMGNAVTGPAPADDARGMGGSAVSLGDWTGPSDTGKTALGRAMDETGAPNYGDPVYGGVSRRELNHSLGSEGMTGQQVWDQAQQERLADYGSAKNGGTPLGQGADFDPYNWDR